jgi:tetratricopeptide (TPR) repeat protein
MRWRCLACLAVLLAPTQLAGAPLSVPPQKDWHQLTTTNFRVIGNAGERDLRRVATRLEQFRETLGILFPKAVLVSSVPTTVIVFRSDKEYVPFKPLYNGKPKDIAGFFLPGQTANYVTMSAAGLEQFGRTIYHEYVHLVMNNNMEHVPVWFGEGLAEYYATFEVAPSGTKAFLGALQSGHVLQLREQWMPLPALLAAGHDSPYYNESDKMSVFYAESWALVHYLLLRNQGRPVEGMTAFVADVSNGRPPEQACQSAFNMTLSSLEREVRRYVEGDRFARQAFTFPTRIGSLAQVPVTPLDEAPVHAVLGDLLFRMQRTDEARAQLDAALALAPELPEAHGALGRLLLASNHGKDATAHLEKAIAAPDAPWASHFEYAALLLEARAAGAPERDADIERALRKTIELQPSFPEAYIQLAWLKSQSGDSADEAIGLAKRALTLAPGNDRCWLLLASLYVLRADYPAAKAVASRLATGARDETVRVQATTLLTGANEMLDREKRSPVSLAGGRRPGAALPQLRTPEAGEERIAGTLREIRCPSAAAPLAFVVEAHGASTTYEASSFEQVQFISYRADLTGQISCGTQASPTVILTFTAGAAGRPARAVALEFVPLGYEPK